MPTEAALAEDFRQGQARIAAKVQAAMRRAFDRYAVSDPAAYERVALQVLTLGHAESAALAETYYAGAREAAGLPPIAPEIEPVVFDAEAATVSLRVTNTALVGQKVASGLGVQAAVAMAQVAALRYAKRAVLGGGRETVTRMTSADSEGRGVARISDGAPCAFCSMLIGRGPVYTTETAKFRAHDGCGCMPSPVFKGGSDGWTPEARRQKKLYEDARDGKILDKDGNPRSYRSIVDEERRAKMAGETPDEAPEPRPRVDPAESRLARFNRLSSPDRDFAQSRVNPDSATHINYRTNCHNVVAAGELRARGYDVKARPTSEAQGRFSHTIARDWETVDGQTREFTRLVDPLTRGNSLRAKTLMARTTEDWPVGARGYVSGAWKTGGGHIFNVEKTDAGLVYHEAQVPGKDAGAYLQLMKTSSISVLRVDDLVPSERISNVVTAADDVKRGAEVLEAERDYVQHRVAYSVIDSSKARARAAEISALPVEEVTAELSYEALYLRAMADAIDKEVEDLVPRIKAIDDLLA